MLLASRCPVPRVAGRPRRRPVHACPGARAIPSTGRPEPPSVAEPSRGRRLREGASGVGRGSPSVRRRPGRSPSGAATRTGRRPAPRSGATGSDSAAESMTLIPPRPVPNRRLPTPPLSAADVRDSRSPGLRTSPATVTPAGRASSATPPRARAGRSPAAPNASHAATDAPPGAGSGTAARCVPIGQPLARPPPIAFRASSSPRCGSSTDSRSTAGRCSRDRRAPAATDGVARRSWTLAVSDARLDRTRLDGAARDPLRRRRALLGARRVLGAGLPLGARPRRWAWEAPWSPMVRRARRWPHRAPPGTARDCSPDRSARRSDSPSHWRPWASALPAPEPGLAAGSRGAQRLLLGATLLASDRDAIALTLLGAPARPSRPTAFAAPTRRRVGPPRSGWGAASAGDTGSSRGGAPGARRPRAAVEWMQVR